MRAYRRAMRWEHLFDDLETQLEQELSAEELDLEAEEERLRLGRLGVRDRLHGLCRAAGDTPWVAVTLACGERLVVHPVAIGRDWFSADLAGAPSRPRQCVVPIGAIVGLALEPASVPASLEGPSAAALSDRLGIAFVLRDLCRRRRAVDLVLTTGEVHGTLDRVGRDHVDVAVHERGVPRRAEAVREVRIVPLVALQYVRF